MRHPMLLAALAAAALLPAGVPDAHARRAAMPATMGDGPKVEAPRGFVEMCRTDPALCATGDAPAAAVDEEAIRKTLRKVNRLVNGRVRQSTDLAAFGQAELWQRSGIGWGARGDCEDLAIEKRERLIAAGVPGAMLFYATAFRPDLGLHIVLVARTGKGDLVLDSRSPYIVPWYDAPYQWVSRQHADEPMRWSMIRDPLVTRALASLGEGSGDTAAVRNAPAAPEPANAVRILAQAD